MSNTASETILHHLGGNKFIVMTGAKNFMSHGYENALSFRLSSTITLNKSNYVKITLNSNDLYDVFFGNIRKLILKDVGSFKNIYAEDLVNIFESETGIITKLF